MDVDWNYDAQANRFSVAVGFVSPQRIRQLAFGYTLGKDGESVGVDAVSWTELLGMIVLDLVAFVSSRDIDWWTVFLYATTAALYFFTRTPGSWSAVITALASGFYAAVATAVIGADAWLLLVAGILGTEVRFFCGAVEEIRYVLQRGPTVYSAKLTSIEQLLVSNARRKIQKRDAPAVQHVCCSKEESAAPADGEEAADEEQDAPGLCETPPLTQSGGASSARIPRNDLYEVAREKGFQS
jgi:hypothetical protein